MSSRHDASSCSGTPPPRVICPSRARAPPFACLRHSRLFLLLKYDYLVACSSMHMGLGSGPRSRTHATGSVYATHPGRETVGRTRWSHGLGSISRTHLWVSTCSRCQVLAFRIVASSRLVSGNSLSLLSSISFVFFLVFTGNNGATTSRQDDYDGDVPPAHRV